MNLGSGRGGIIEAMSSFPCVAGPAPVLSNECEQVLRSLPRWFGREKALLEYAADATRWPTFVARTGDTLVGFLTVHSHFAQAWELHCVAVHADWRGRGLGRQLHDAALGWLQPQGVTLLQVKTVGEAHPSPEYAQTRQFYAALGYQPLETFDGLWGPGLPVLQLVKCLGDSS